MNAAILIIKILVLLLLGWSPMVEDKLHVGKVHYVFVGEVWINDCEMLEQLQKGVCHMVNG
jgi:hypothetical protein